MVREQDRSVPLLVEAAEQRQQLVAGDGIELRGRLVQDGERRPAGQGGGQRHALELAAGELVGGPVQQGRDPEGQGRLLDAARDGRGRLTAVLQGKGELGAHRAHDHLGLGILEQRPHARRQLAGPVLAHVHAGHRGVTADLAAVHVRHQAAGHPQQRRLPRSRRPGQQHQLPGLHLERHVAQRRRARAGVAIREVLEREHRGHRPTPRRSANGASAQAIIAAAVA